MPKPAAPWPHAPKHELSENGTYFVTAGTYLKAHHFRTPQRLDVLERGLLSVAYAFSWDIEAWAVFSNHYHFVAHSQGDSADARSLSQTLGYFTREPLAGSTESTKLRGARSGITFGTPELPIKNRISRG